MVDATLDAAEAFAATHGLLVGGGEGLLKPVPMALQPVAFPRASFDEAVALAEPFGRLVDAVARDPEWLHATLAPVLEGDPFTARLVALHKQVLAEGVRQPAALGLLRSDYMLNEPDGRLLQVELNTIAASFGCLSSRVCELHRFLAARGLGLASEPAGELPAANDALAGLAAGLAAAHAHYGVPGAEVLFVVQPGERNACDQRLLEFELFQTHGVRVRRLSLAEVAAQGALGAAGELLLDGGAGPEVAVVYLRAGYTPDDYPGEAEWEGRALAERSRAIKCPNVAYHLVGAKKVQQALAAPGALERFAGSEADAAAMRASFAGLWTPTPDALERMRAAPERFVLKPQREGGGNNIYGADIPAAVDAMSAEELLAYILMERIEPAENPSVLARDGQTAAGRTLSELGIYSTFLASGDGGGVVRNQYEGFLVRTKMVGVDEGGVASGFAVLNCVSLV